MGVGKPDFREGQVENRAKTAQFLWGLRGNFPNLSLNHTGTLHATFVSCSSLKIEQKTLKNYVLQIISIHSLKVAPLPRQNFGQSLKFYYTSLSGKN